MKWVSMVKQRRLEWCKARRHWTLEQWKRFLWSDESWFTIWQSGGRIWIWWMEREILTQWHSRRCCASNFVVTVWGRPFSVSAWQFPRAQSEVHTEMVCRDRCRKPDWPAQSPDLNPIEHIWDELERRLRARPNCPTSVPDFTNAFVAEWK
jgi:hypothetical protein